jgi:plastocyanin
VKAYSAIVLVAALGLLSCDSGPNAAPAPVTHTVTIEAVAFKPDDLTIKPGDTVVWVNKDPFPHTATSKAGFDSKDIAAEKTWTFKATQAGEFPYTCTYHPTMKGVLRVK